MLHIWMSHVTHMCVWPDLSICVTWLTHMCDPRCQQVPTTPPPTHTRTHTLAHTQTHTNTHTKTHTHTSDQTHLHVCHDSFTCVMWLIHMCDMTHSHVWHISISCVSWLLYMCVMTPLHVCHDSFRSQRCWKTHMMHRHSRSPTLSLQMCPK